MWCAHYLWWYSPAFIWWRSGTIIRLTAVVTWIRKITQPFIVNIVTETSTTLRGITIYMGLVGQPDIYSLACLLAMKFGKMHSPLALSGKASAIKEALMWNVLYLYWVVVEVWNDDMVLRINGHEMRSGKFVWFTSPGSKLLYEFPIWLKDENARGPIIDHHQMTRTVHCNALWTWKT